MSQGKRRQHHGSANGEKEPRKNGHQDPIERLVQRVKASEARIQKLAKPHGILGKFGRTAVP